MKFSRETFYYITLEDVPEVKKLAYDKITKLYRKPAFDLDRTLHTIFFKANNILYATGKIEADRYRNGKDITEVSILQLCQFAEVEEITLGNGCVLYKVAGGYDIYYDGDNNTMTKEELLGLCDFVTNTGARFDRNVSLNIGCRTFNADHVAEIIDFIGD